MIELKPVAGASDTPLVGLLVESGDLQLIGEASIEYKTASNQIFVAKISIRKNEDQYGTSMVCTSVPGNFSHSAFAAYSGNLPNLLIAEVDCEDIQNDVTHFSKIRFQLSSDPSNEYGILR